MLKTTIVLWHRVLDPAQQLSFKKIKSLIFGLFGVEYRIPQNPRDIFPSTENVNFVLSMIFTAVNTHTVMHTTKI